MSYRHESCVLGRPADSCPLRGYCDCRYDPPPSIVPQTHRPAPRDRHRHTRAHVAAQRHRDGPPARREPVDCVCHLCYRRGHLREAQWRKNVGEPPRFRRRQRDADRADLEASR